MRRPVDSPVHLIGWASQPDLQRVCDESWTTPKWGTEDEQRTTEPKVYVDDDDKLYTFEFAKVTCPGCLGKTKED